MDIQELLKVTSESDRMQRANYHLTYGDLIKALKSAPADAVFDERIVGLSAYRGYYSDIALNTESSGYNAEKEPYDYEDHNMNKYREWQKENEVSDSSIPTNANELGALLESLLGLHFEGYKGGTYKITEDKPLWLASDYGNCSDISIVGITDDLKLVTKEIE